MKKQIRINNLNELKEYILNDLITPGQAVEVICKSLKIISFKKNPTKNEVIQVIDDLKQYKHEKPIFIFLENETI
jgi:hypothetical protein